MRLVGLVFVWMRFRFQYSGVSFFEETLGCFLKLQGSLCVCGGERRHVCSASLQIYSYDERMFDAPATFPKNGTLTVFTDRGAERYPTRLGRTRQSREVVVETAGAARWNIRIRRRHLSGGS